MFRLPQFHRMYRCALIGLLLFPPCLLAEVLVVTGEKSTLTALDKNQVRNVFLGKVTSLPDGSNAIPIDQPESSPLRDEFYTKLTSHSAAEAKAHWVKLSFTGRGMPPRASVGSSDIKKILNSTPGAIGYIEKTELDSSVKVLFTME